MKSKSLPSGTRKSAKYRILIVEDHPIFRQGMIQLINHEPDLVVCEEAETAVAAILAIQKKQPDLALIDLTLKGTNGIELIKNIKVQFPGLPVLVLSMHEESLYAARAMMAGARGYVMKQEAASQVMLAIRTVLKGEFYLSATMNSTFISKFIGGPSAPANSLVDNVSDRELEILQLIGKGRTSREIAADINISIKTVESHRAHLKEKLQLKTATELIRFAVEWMNRAV